MCKGKEELLQKQHASIEEQVQQEVNSLHVCRPREQLEHSRKEEYHSKQTVRWTSNGLKVYAIPLNKPTALKRIQNCKAL